MLLSVIVPCYNKQDSVKLTLDSLLKQTVLNYIEIICVNDCSTDNTLNILEEYKNNNKHVNMIIHTQPKNMGLFAARIAGVSISHGKFIATLDADDWCDRDFYEDMLYESLPDKVSRDDFNRYLQDNNLNKLFNKYYKQCVDIVYNCSVIKYYAPNKQYDAKESILTVHPYGTYLVDPANKTLDGVFTNNWNIVWNKIYKRDVIWNITQIPSYRVNMFEDILISFICYMNAEFIKIVNTNSKIYYNLTDEVDHVSNDLQTEEKKKKTAESTATVFLTLSALINEYNKFEWLELIKSYRNFYVNHYTDTLRGAFKERFDETNDYYFISMDRNEFNNKQDYFNKSLSYDNIYNKIAERFIGEHNLASFAKPTQAMIENEKQKALTILNCLESVDI